MGNIQEDLVTAMANKNPAARAETLLFMQRSFQLCTPDMLSKPFLKAICPLIVSVRCSVRVYIHIVFVVLCVLLHF